MKCGWLFQRETRPASIGGILRDDRGVVKAYFAASIGIKDSNEAEFIAMVFALEMSLQKEWLREKEIIVESDSKNALAWINRRDEYPWDLRFYCNKLYNILQVLKRLVSRIKTEKLINMQMF